MSENTVTVNVTTPVNVNANFPNGGSFSMHLPNVGIEEDRNVKIREALQLIMDQFPE